MTMNEQDDQRRQPLLAALDIDGTLARPATMQIDRSVRDAIARFVAAGHHVVLASGRSLVGVLPIARSLGLAEGWAVASNGAVTVRLDPRTRRGYELDDVQNFDPGPVVRSSRAELPGLQIAAERVGWGYDVTHLFPTGQLNGAQQIVSARDLAGRETTRLVLRGPGAGRLAEPVRAAGLSAVLAEEDWLDVTGPGLSKATALEKVRANLGVEPSRTVAIGDGRNDLEMFRWAAHAVAMGHAPAVVREAADAVTGNFDEHGAAVALDALHADRLHADALHSGTRPAFS
ncbi:HAD family hydrolase [Promicromonospora sukumoe]|uniref:HAD family hydrolase n=1 Tax=Promicromonospora sukumoe TaxID=88382 RepID=UPI0037C5F3B8